ncbi:polysaccharide biosynthesis/export family protein, partial [Nodosilinea sp. LEGE 07298]|uniref:polysaccharide biosynthesis/export family protein n=1 Tax=Nodosilinea sp. LEGE 07298 TaxID=2777970 RepID=UPI00187F5A14
MNRFCLLSWSLGTLALTLTLGSGPGLAQSQPLPLNNELNNETNETVAPGPRLPNILTPEPNASFPEAYVLGPGDRIRIDIFNIPEFSGPENGVHEVLVDGTLALPMAGTVDVQGLTLTEAQAALTASYAPLLTRP